MEVMLEDDKVNGADIGQNIELTFEEDGADICGGYEADIGKIWS